MNLANGLAYHEAHHSWILGGHGFNSCQGLSFFSLSHACDAMNIISSSFFHDPAENLLSIPGLKITAGQRAMSGQNDDLSGQNFGSAVI